MKAFRQTAGGSGIGGLLARSVYSGYTVSTNHAYYHADGNGNISAMVNASGTLQAEYSYDPFGRTINQSGTLSGVNTMMFSSMPYVFMTGSVTGLQMYYYGYRFYDPSTQRWINRDAAGELSGINLYIFNRNDGVQMIDPDGNEAVSIPWPYLTFPTLAVPGAAEVLVTGTIMLGTGYIVVCTVDGLCSNEPQDVLYPSHSPDRNAPPIRCEMGHGGKRGWASKNPNDKKAEADRKAGRDRGTGKTNRPPEEDPEDEEPSEKDPLRGKFPKEPASKIMPPKDGAPARPKS